MSCSGWKASYILLWREQLVIAFKETRNLFNGVVINMPTYKDPLILDILVFKLYLKKNPTTLW